MYSNSLYHHGIKGMRWGIRRYQNKDGTLTPAGRKRVSEAYKRESEALMDDAKKSANKMYVDANNKVADRLNNGGIDRFNKQQEKKYGEKYAERDGYEEEFFDMVDRETTKLMNRTLHDFYMSNEHYQKAQSLVDKYGMDQWDDLARKNVKIMQELRDAVEHNR